jgi:hypothetical protein
MIKVNYETHEEGLTTPEKTDIVIYPNRIFVKYNIKSKAESVVKQMWKDGKRGVTYSRGCMVQSFPDKTEEEILEIVKKDIENGIIVAKEKTGKQLKIMNLKIE